MTLPSDLGEMELAEVDLLFEMMIDPTLEFI